MLHNDKTGVLLLHSKTCNVNPSSLPRFAGSIAFPCLSIVVYQKHEHYLGNSPNLGGANQVDLQEGFLRSAPNI